MPKWEIHEIYKSAFGFQDGDVFRIVGNVERWPGWEDRLRLIVEAVNTMNQKT